MINIINSLDKKSKIELRNYLTRSKKVVIPRTMENFLGALDSIFQTETQK
ncbi:MAG: hypothetical protein ACFFDN_51460 [Candidatus Hodarchaeota archaeon]